MILGAGLLVLAGLGLFVAALLTGINALYWACVAVCVVAAVLLVLARRDITARAAPSTTTAMPPSAGAGGAPSTAATSPAAGSPAAAGSTAASTAVVETRAAEPVRGGTGAVARDETDPEVEEVEVTDLLVVVDLKDEVLVVDEHPRYHVAGCTWLGDRETIPIPLDEARTDGFTPCAVCRPDRTLADRARSRR